MTLPLPAVIIYSFVTSAVIGLTASFLTDRIPAKNALLVAVGTTVGMVVVRMV